MLTAPPSADLTRRHVIYGSAGMAAAGLFPSAPLASAEAGIDPDEEKQTAVLIGRIDSESRLNECLTAIDRHGEIRLTALADADEGYHPTARARTGVSRTYPDFRILLGAEEPELAVIASGLEETERHEAILASLEAGAHVFIDGPLPGSLAEIDAILSLAREKERLVAIANPLRFDPVIRNFADHAADLIGEILEVRVLGNMDGENARRDLIGTGVSLFDIVRLIAGDAETCNSTLQGSDLIAHYRLAGGADLTYLDRPAMREASGGPGIRFTGTKTSARLYLDPKPVVSVLQNPSPANPNRGELWRKWPAPSDAAENPEDDADTKAGPLDDFGDWLDAIESGREPAGALASSARSLEMAHAVFHAAARGESIPFPLADRGLPPGMA